jgi:hypothetical protein
MTYIIKFTCNECKEHCSIEHRIGDWDFRKLSDKCPNCKQDSLCAYQPERLSEKTRKGSDSLNSLVTMRGKSEEVFPPEDPFKCAKCCKSFDPSDWQNDICDDCLYGRIRS